ncbi:PHB depolymerase family esterase [Dactylosporangium sp. NPDC005572]|uniref:alpha/beta hydrolase family esterase n=1 Tax=Dactylosporangium sp. NPDC005572 TaxID=3156889 RepID=UPI0033A80CF7
MRTIACLVLVALLLTGCGRADRTYRLYLPASLPAGEAVPLVVVLHGGFGSARQAERAYGWDALADREGFAVVYPDGQGRAWNAGGGCCGRPGREGVDDVAYVLGVVAAVRAARPVDPDRIYATGISNGGLMAYRLACDTDVFAAIGPDAATLLGGCPDPAPVSVLHLHGTADTMVRPDGAPGDGFADIDGPPVADVVELWRTAGGCAPPVTTTVGAQTRSTAQCPQGRAVDLVLFDGAGHEWLPGATATFWEFFAAHPRKG